MGFLERSRSLRRKDSAVPLRIKTEQSPAIRIGVKETNTPVKNTPVRSTPATPRDGNRPATTGKTASGAQKDKDAGRPRTAGRASEREQPPMPEYHAFKFPTPQESPRASASHSRNLTLHANGSMQALDSPRKAPEYKRSFTTPMHVPQASIHKGTVKLSSRDLPKLEPTPAPAQKKQPTLHKSKSSTWRSFFQRKQSKPPIPDFDANQFVSQSPATHSVPDLPALPALPAPSSKVESRKQMAPPAPPPKITGHVRNESRGMARQTMHAEPNKTTTLDKNSGPSVSKTPAGSRRASLKQERPSMSRSTTGASLAVSEQYFDAVSNASGSPRSVVEKGPRLEISIPTVELERYSVMFEKLLKPKQSILERRKTAIQVLSLPGESHVAGRLTPSLDTPGGTLQRRATSPNLMTPLTAQFLENSSQVATPVAIHRVSAAPPRIILRRSHTAPPGAFSPAPTQFDTKEKMPQRQQQQEAVDNTASACSTHNSPMWSEASLPATPNTTSSDTATFMSFNDDDDEEEEYEISEAKLVTHDSKAPKHALKEPSWEMITRSPSSTSSTTLPPPIPPKAPGRTSREPSRERQDQHPPRTSSLDSSNSGGKQSAPQQHIITQSQAHPNPLQSHQVRRPVQISVARQVSVRRPPGASPSQKTPMSVQPVYSKQPLRPKVVEVRNRKSTMIVLESASSSASSASVSRESLLPPPLHR